MPAEVDALEAARLVRDGAVLVDVREDDEWAAGHAPDALHAPMSRLRNELDALPTDRLLVCICHVGQRSAAVAAALENAGYDTVNAAGGMQAWEAAGLAVVTWSGHRPDHLIGSPDRCEPLPATGALP